MVTNATAADSHSIKLLQANKSSSSLDHSQTTTAAGDDESESSVIIRAPSPLPNNNSSFVESTTRSSQEFFSSFSLQDLPEHILVHIFQFLCDSRLSQLSAANYCGLPWIQQHSSLSPVCKSWYRASSHDSLWRSCAADLYDMLKNRNANQCIFEEGLQRKNFMPRTVLKQNIRVKKLPKKLPDTGMKNLFLRMKRKQQETFVRLQHKEVKEAKLAQKFTIFEKHEPKLHTLLLIFILVLATIFVILLAIHEILSFPRIFYFCTLIPFYLIMIFSIGFLILVLLDEVGGYYMYYWRTSPCQQGAILFSIAFAVVWMLITSFAIMLALNLAALPLLPESHNKDISTWDRRIHQIPWHVVFSPILLILSVAALVLYSIFLFDMRAKCRAKRYLDLEYWSLFAGLGISMVIAFIVLLGFHFEFPKSMNLGVSFTPLYILEVMGFFAFLAMMRNSLRFPYSSRKHLCCRITKYICLLMLPMSLIISHVLISLHSIIGGYGHLGFIVVIINAAMLFTVAVNEPYQ